MSHSRGQVRAFRGAYVTYQGNPLADDQAFVYESDGLVVVSEGLIIAVGPATAELPDLPPSVPIQRLKSHQLMVAGFVDCHVHYPQTQIMGAYGEQLLDWLNQYTFVAEQQFAHPEHANKVAQFFLDECLRNGTTTASVFCTVHPQSVDAFFRAATARNMRMIAGKVLMDRHAPDALLDSAQRGYDESKALINQWHNKGRNAYAITPRFAPTSTPDQLAAAGALWQEQPDCLVQSHVAENPSEIDWALSLFPDCRNYLDIYDRFGLLGKRAIYGHGIWLSDAERMRCHETGTALAHCPTSNGFLGSGLFDAHKTQSGDHPVTIGLGTDVGAGTSFSMFQTLNEAYKVAQLNGHAMSSIQAFYLATLGGAKALGIEGQVGSLSVGKEADFLVLNMAATPLMRFRMQTVEDIEEALFVLMTLADDRAVEKVYVAGCLANQDLNAAKN